MAAKIIARPSRVAGFTLLELLLVIALIAFLVSVTAWGRQKWIQDWRLRQAGQQLYEELKRVQADAEMTGSLTIGNGLLLTRKIFLVFEENTGSYAAYHWLDSNADGLAQTGETSLQWRQDLPAKIAYAWGPGITRRACSNVNNPPNRAISFSSPNRPPCNDQPCIKFDHNGFSIMGPGAVYLSDGQQSLAITATRPGHFTMCEWDGSRWR